MPIAELRSTARRLCLSAPIVLVAALGALAGCRGEPAPPGGERATAAAGFADGAPRLVLFLVIDQGGADVLQRYRPLFDGGLARLMDEGVQFTDTHQAHAITETAPGHATLASGRYPSHHGIIGNDWIDPESGDDVYAVEDSEYGVSPAELATDTLGDWLRAAAPDARVFTASGKDRAAILLGGHGADAAYWYSRSTGRFVTSGYYDRSDREPEGEETPPWLERFDEEQAPVEWFGTLWQPLPEVAAAQDDLGLERVDLGAMNPVQSFPHALGDLSLAPDEAYFRDLYGTPFADVYLERFVEALIDGEGLGEDATPDLLAVSFSALDSVGHWYGPESPELVDTLVRLDQTLGRLLDAVDRRVGLDRTLVVLSADHGVLDVPELLAARGEDAARLSDRDVACFHRVDAALDARWGEADWFRPGPFLNRDAVDALLASGADGVTGRAAIEEVVRHELEACPHVERVWTRSELEALGDSPGPAAGASSLPRLYAHAFFPARSPDFLIRFAAEFLPVSLPLATSHGSPYPYDTHVPWVTRLPGAPADAGARARAGATTDRARVIDTYAETVDVAPTVAALLGIPTPADVDGTDRSDRLRHR